MEKLQETSILKFHPNTMEAIRKEFGLDREMIEQSLSILDQWLAMQSHLVKKDLPSELMERILINCKGSVEKAKEKIDKMCTVKSLLPEFFVSFDAKADYELFKGGFIDSVWPSLTPNHERVIFIRNIGFQSNDMLIYYRRLTKILDYILRYDYSLGVHIVMDCTDANIVEYAGKINLVEAQQGMSIFEAYSHRLKSMRFITPNKMVDMLITIVKQVIRAKLAQRIYVHQKFEELFEVFPKEMVPKDYGGSEKSLVELNDDLTEVLTSENFVSYLKEMSKAVTDENLRRKDSYNESVMGMPGSFRQFALD